MTLPLTITITAMAGDRLKDFLANLELECGTLRSVEELELAGSLSGPLERRS
jgi:hypothetical protein